MEQFDNSIIYFLQEMGPWLTPVMLIFTVIGSGVFSILIASFFIWNGHYRMGVRLALIYSLAGGLNSILKLYFRDPRPYWANPLIQGLQPSAEFGMPSGHAQGTAAFWGYLAFRYRTVPVALISFAMVFFIGVSRIQLGVHSPSQVLAGWGAGLLILFFFLLTERSAAKFISRMKPVSKLIMYFSISMLLITGAVLVMRTGQLFILPSEWIENAMVFSETPINPFVINTVLTSAGAFFGLAAGSVIYTHDTVFFRNFSRPHGGLPGPGGRKAALFRYLAGYGGMLFIFLFFQLIVYFLENTIHTGTEELLLLTIIYLQFTSIGFWITGFAPLLFLHAVRRQKSETAE